MRIIAKASRSIRRHFNAEPVVWAIISILFVIFANIRNLFFSWLFNARGIRIGSGYLLRGTKQIKFGEYFSALNGCWIEAVVHYRNQSFSPRILIGDRVSVSKNVHITCIELISIGNDVLFGSNVYISDHNHGKYSGDKQSLPDEKPADRELSLGGAVIIEDKVWIGDNVVVLGPVRIGSGAVIAANSVVKADVPPATIMAGVPARIIRQFNSNLSLWEKI